MRLKFYMLCWVLMAGVQYGFCQGGTWIWVKGSDSTGAPANFGSLGVEAASNNPQGFYEALNWIDNQGNFWLFGGVGVYLVPDSVFSYQLDTIADSIYVDGVLDSIYYSFFYTRIFDSVQHRNATGTQTLYLNNDINLKYVIPGDDSVNTLFNVTNDMWKYSPATDRWTWIGGPKGVYYDEGHYGTKGVPSPENWPPSRGWGSISWTDNNGNLWCFGGFGPYGVLNDLWRYDMASGEWTWMSGDSIFGGPDNYGVYQQPSDVAKPGGRQECSTAWVDGGNGLWFFGGMDASTAPYNDIWKFDIGTNEWAWMNGPQGINQPGNYGTFGVESPSNVPPPRGTYTRWKDANGSFYIWGGISSFYIDGGQVLSDVWKYNTVTNNWAWVGGDSVVNTLGNYGLKCIDNGHTGPMARGENRTSQVLGCSNAFLTFGGFHYVNENFSPALNDMWLFNTQTYEWRWVSGTENYGDTGSYGQQGIGSPGNLPPSRFGGCLWTDNTGNLWTFSGQNSPGTAVYNDMWKFIPDNACLGTSLLGGINYTLTPNNLCLGDSALLTIDSTVGSVQVTPLANATRIDAHHYILYPDSSSSYLITGNSTCRGNDSAAISLIVSKPANFQYSLTDTVLCVGNFSVLTVSGALNVQVSPNYNFFWHDSANAVISPDTTTIYTLVAQLACSANDTLTFGLHVDQPLANVYADTDLICPGGTANLCATAGFASYAWDSGSTTTCFATHVAGTYSVTVTDDNGCTGTSNAVDVAVQIPGSFFSELQQPLICIGGSTLLLVADTNIFYSPQGSITWISQDTGLLKPDTTTTYILIAQVLCAVDTAVYTLQVSNPQVSISASKNPVCVGDSAVICATSGYSNYAWNSGSNTTCFSDIPGTYAVTITDQYNCVAQSMPFTLSSTQAGQFAYGFSDSIVCFGTPAALSISGNSSISLSPDSNVITVDSADYLLSPGASTNYVLIAQIPCSVTDTVIIPVQVIPAPSVSILPQSTGICPNDSDLLCANQNFNSYTWSNGDTTACIYVHDTGSYYIIATDQNNCTGLSSPLSIGYITPQSITPQLTDTQICYGKTVTLSYPGASSVQLFPAASITILDSAHALLHPDTTTAFLFIALNSCNVADTSAFTLPVYHPSVSIMQDSSTICFNDSVQLCASAGLTAYSWSTGENSACIYAYQSGSFEVTVTDSHQCQALDSASVFILPVPSISISISGDTFTAYDDTALQWYSNGVAIPGANGQTYIAPQPGNYSVLIQGQNGCTSISNVFYYTSDISNIQQDHVDIYPNPLEAGAWHLDVSPGFIGQTMQIFDNDGRAVYSAEIHSLHTEISPGFASGIYFLRINSPDNSVVKKIIKL